jgi:hypothetical protein
MRLGTLLAAWLLLMPGVARAAALPAEDIQVLYDQKLPLRDGVRLSANIFRPRALPAPLPAILVLTPYTNDHNTPRGIYFATHGYVFVTVDCRGRGNSDGEFTPFVNEGRDGYDVVEWIARQPWCNGKVATIGGSYKGMDQWLIAKENPPHLAAMAPTATVAPGIDAVGDRNILRSYNLNILSYVFGRTLNRENFFSDYNRAVVQAGYRQHRPYAELLDALAAPPDNHLQKVFATWIAHPALDRYWLDMLPSPAEFARIRIPILTITGYFDDDQPGTMYYYDNFQRYGSAAARAGNFFIIGPWDHAGTRHPVDHLGGLRFGPGSVLDIFDLHRQWFDWTLKGAARPAFLKDRVAYFSMGADLWRYAPDLAAIAGGRVSYHLDPAGVNPTDPFRSGRLRTDPVPAAGSAHLVYDPLRLAGQDQAVADSGQELTSQAYLNEDGWLYFHSPVLAEDLEISGYLTLHAFVQIDAPDTDFDYKLYELKADGSSVFLAHGLMRARYRTSLEQETLVVPGSINEYTIQSLNLINRQIPKGSRLRLKFGYLDNPDYQKNYNSGGDVSRESARDARTVDIRLHCGSQYPSRLDIPVRPGP